MKKSGFILYILFWVQAVSFSQAPSAMTVWVNTPAKDSLVTYLYKKGKDTHTVLRFHKNGTYTFHLCAHIYGKERIGSRDWTGEDKGTWQLSGDTLSIRPSSTQQTEKLVARRKKLQSLSDKKTYKARSRALRH